MQDIVKSIAFNPYGYTMSDLREMVSWGDVSLAELAGVLGHDVAGMILDGELASPLPMGNANEAGMRNMDEATQVMVWGMPKSGKTLVIASLLSLEGMEVQHFDPTATEGMSARIRRMKGLFANKMLQHVPKDESTGKVNHPVIYRPHLMGKAYPIIFTEATIPQNGSIDVGMYVRSDHLLVHVFCIDCRQNIQKQERRMREVMKALMEKEYLGRTDGVYVLVTKTDLMNAPVAYKDNAAQTLVTKGMPELWRDIQKMCFEKQIYNVLPIPFSAGHFVIRDLARLDATDAEMLFHDALLPKCQPRRNMLERALSKGKWWQAAILGIILSGLLIWGGYEAYEVLTAPPTAPMLPYDYKTAFLEEVKGLKNMSYEKASELYSKKRKDLTLERELLDASGKAILKVEDVRTCDSTLTNDYAKVLSDKCSKLLSSNQWSKDGKTLNQLYKRLEKLLKHDDVLLNGDVKKNHTILDDYFKHVKPLIAKSEKCKSIKDVDEVEKEDGQSWLKDPYYNDDELKTGLRMATVNAYKNCARYYSDQVDTIIKKYPEDYRYTFPVTYKDVNVEIRTELLNPYKNSVDSLLSRLDEKGESFDDARSILQGTLKKIKRYSKTSFF